MNFHNSPEQVEADITVWADEVIFTPVKLHDGTKVYRLTTKHGKRIATFYSTHQPTLNQRNPTTMTEKIIRDCANEFARELSKFATKLDIPTWREPEITLKVTFSKERGPKLSLSFCNSNTLVHHTSLGILMDEVYRREGFDGKANLSMDQESAALRSLTFSPTNPTDSTDSTEE